METSKTKWVIDPSHTKLGFRVKHLMITNVTGYFKELSGEVLTDGDDFKTVEIALSINTASIETESPDRNTHLKSPDFFDSENYPVMTFRSSGMKDLGDDIYELTGMLNIKGVEKTVQLSAEFGGVIKDPWGNLKAGFTVTGKINRKDWGLNWNASLETGGVLVGEEVKLSCDVELLKQAG